MSCSSSRCDGRRLHWSPYLAGWRNIFRQQPVRLRWFAPTPELESTFINGPAPSSLVLRAKGARSHQASDRITPRCLGRAARAQVQRRPEHTSASFDRCEVVMKGPPICHIRPLPSSSRHAWRAQHPPIPVPSTANMHAVDVLLMRAAPPRPIGAGHAVPGWPGDGGSGSVLVVVCWCVLCVVGWSRRRWRRRCCCWSRRRRRRLQLDM